jgi:hypothetical protein
MAEVESDATTSELRGMAYPVVDEAESSWQTRWTQEFTSPRVARYQRLMTSWEGDRMSGTVSVDLVEEVSGITRMDVELR